MKGETVRKIRYIMILPVCIAGAVLGLIVLRFRGSVAVHTDETIPLNQEVVFYRQDDEQWATETMGNSRYTLGESGCLVSCIASAVTMMGDEKTPYTLNEMFSRKSANKKSSRN